MSFEAAEVVVGLLVGLSHLAALHQRKAFVVFLFHYEVDEPLHHGHAPVQRHGRPGLFACDGGCDRPAHVLLRGGWHGVDKLARRGVQHLYYFSVRGVGGRTVDVHFHVAVSSCVVLSNFLNVVARLPRHSQFLVGGNDLDGYGRAGA